MDKEKEIGLDLEIDTIGGLSSLTLAAEKALNDFFKKKRSIKKATKKINLALSNSSSYNSSRNGFGQ